MKIFVLLLVLWMPEEVKVGMVGAYPSLNQCIAAYEWVLKLQMDAAQEGTFVTADCVAFDRGEAV